MLFRSPQNPKPPATCNIKLRLNEIQMSSNKKDSAAAAGGGGESHYTTASGREVRKTGKKNISEALAQLRAAREGGDKRTDQY